MFNAFVAGLMEKIFHFLQKHPDLFKLEDKQRAEALENLQLAKPLKEYLATVSEKKFFEEIHQALNFSQNAKDQSLTGNKFLLSVIEFLTNDIALKIDLLPENFSLLKVKEREEIAEKLISGDSSAAESLRAILVHFSYQQIANEIYTLSNKVHEVPYIIVQTPRAADHELKREIRKKLLEKHPNSFPSFQINRKLIGGIRLFINGQNIDHSWLSRVLRFASLTSV